MILQKDNGKSEDVTGLIKYVYSDFIKQADDYFSLQECAILPPTNDDVHNVNESILNIVHGEKRCILTQIILRAYKTMS